MRRLVVLLTLVALAAAAIVASGNTATSSKAADTITIGASLPLSGDKADPGKEAKRGYQVWQKLVNASGGLIGQQVKLEIKDDASDQNTIVSDYNALISRDKVDLLLGTFSSFLNLPASAVAERNRMVYVEPAGGSPEMFTRGFKYLFFAQQATAPHQADLFSSYIKGLAKAKRPKTAAFVSIDDPFAEPVIDTMKKKLSAAGIKVTYYKIYPQGTTNFDTIASAIARGKPDLVAQGAAELPDGVALVRSLIKVGFSPKIMFQTTAPSLGNEYAKGIGGKKNAEGVFYTVSYSPKAPTPMNKQFLSTYHKMFHGQEPAEDAADAFAAAQVLQAAVEGVGEVDQAKIANWLHHHAVDTILGKLSWDKRGAPKQAFMLAQWQNGRYQIVLPKSVATSKKIILTKPRWK
ncbi:MAG TPA: amino acid ABC transporter substrate-binding protein [Gaiellaceae bacterium]|nr:amino acid ABC transporter substrate-binding protein [Gaiellaceae bacterium]